MVVKVNIMLSDLIGRYLTLDLNQPIKWADFQLDALLTKLRLGCLKRCQFVVKLNIMSSNLIGGYLTFYLNQPIEWADFRLDALLAETMLTKLRPGCIKRCQVVKVNIMSSNLIGGYLTFYLNQIKSIKWADFRLDALLADSMLTRLYTTGARS
jgi:hypothetical protein